MIALKNILVPHDFSETSEAAMRYAVELARTFGAKLHVVHVSEKARFEMATEFPLGLDMSLEDASANACRRSWRPANSSSSSRRFWCCQDRRPSKSFATRRITPST